MARPIANQPSPSQVSGRLATCHRVLEEMGLEYEDLQAPIDDPTFRSKLVAFWKRKGDINIPGLKYTFKVNYRDPRWRTINVEDYAEVRDVNVGHYPIVDPGTQTITVRYLVFQTFDMTVHQVLEETHQLGCRQPNRAEAETFIRNNPEEWQEQPVLCLCGTIGRSPYGNSIRGLGVIKACARHGIRLGWESSSSGSTLQTTRYRLLVVSQ